MALVLMMGAPASGKTRRAEQLALHWRALIAAPSAAAAATAASEGAHIAVVKPRFKEVVIVSYESVGLTRAAMFANNTSESAGRAKLFSAAERALSSSKCVIADWNHTAKSGRYELWCRARTLGLTYCVVHCNADQSQCERLNEDRADRYSVAQLADLYGRMEWPNSKSRWDAPLIVIDGPDGPLPVTAIDNAVVNPSTIVRLRPGAANLPQSIEPSTFDSLLLQTCSEICSHVLAEQSAKRVNVGDEFVLPYCPNETKLTLTRPIHAHELKRVQSQFISIAKKTSMSSGGKGAIAVAFTQLLQHTLEREQGF